MRPSIAKGCCAAAGAANDAANGLVAGIRGSIDYTNAWSASICNSDGQDCLTVVAIGYGYAVTACCQSGGIGAGSGSTIPYVAIGCYAARYSYGSRSIGIAASGLGAVDEAKDGVGGIANSS